MDIVEAWRVLVPVSVVVALGVLLAVVGHSWDRMDSTVAPGPRPGPGPGPGPGQGTACATDPFSPLSGICIISYRR
jgi:hypothetical protein